MRVITPGVTPGVTPGDNKWQVGSGVGIRVVITGREEITRE